mmetsp:Transcript_25426/g.31266  ORF Transcript_25426/g.31266 Transcript_25426/m.31266 type:complete len:93 (+) Transcript_25426:526-804(+)
MISNPVFLGAPTVPDTSRHTTTTCIKPPWGRTPYQTSPEPHTRPTRCTSPHHSCTRSSRLPALCGSIPTSIQSSFVANHHRSCSIPEESPPS